MTNESIYAQNKHPSFYKDFPHTGKTKSGKDYTPYVYMIEWSELKISYIGAAYRKGCHPYFFWNRDANKKAYFTSSKHVANFVKTNGDPDIIQIRHICATMEEAKQIESDILHQNDAARNENFLNKSNADGKFVYDNHNKVVAYEISDIEMKNGFHISVEEYMTNRDKYFRPSSGKALFIDTETGQHIYINSETAKQDPTRYQSFMKGLLSAIHKETDTIVQITSEEYSNNKNLYKFHASGLATVKVLATGELTKVPMEEYQANKGTLYESVITGTTIVFSIEKNEWIQVDKNFYQQNKNLFKTQSDFGISVIEIETGKSLRITKEEYHKNKHLYKTFTSDKVNVLNIATGEYVQIPKEEFAINRHLYKSSAEGKESHKRGKKSFINKDGKTKFFPEDFNSPDWELCKVLYSIDDDNAKTRPARLLTEHPDKFFNAIVMFDIERQETRYVPKVIYSKYPERYFSLQSPEYKAFKLTQD